MALTIVFPLGKRAGPGSYDTFFDIKKYATLELAMQHNDYVVIDFVRDENNILHFSAYHTHRPDDKQMSQLEIQHFPMGVDIFDDVRACRLAEEIINKTYE